MKRRTAWSLGWMMVVTMAVSGCASLPPAKPATDVKAIAGTWQGTATAPSGAQFPFTSTISEDGRIETIIPALSNPGPRFVARVTVEGGKYRWKSETTGRTGTYVLHEGDGRRVLVSRADDGSSYSEATRR
jgi:hypothetical protein